MKNTKITHQVKLLMMVGEEKMRNRERINSTSLQPSIFASLQSLIRLMTPSRLHKRRATATTIPQYSVLEPKDLLAAVTVSGGTLTIEGTTGNDHATVQISGNYVGVAQPGFDTETFPIASVTSIVFIGRSGDDVFQNSTSIPSRAFGQAGNDTLIGGSGDDTLAGNVGNDIIRGNGGVDRLVAGNGNDDVEGGAGNDTILGTAGVNTLRGGTGNDLIFGGNDVDTIYGDDGDDQLSGNGANDTIRGGDGTDRVNAGPGNDNIFGEGGDDFLYGQAGNDEIDGGAGNDRMGGNGGNDTIAGGAGNDLLSAGLGDDDLSGGTGNDRLYVIAGNNTLSGGSGTDKAEYTAETDKYQIKTGSNNRIETVDFRDSITVVGEVIPTLGDQNIVSSDVENAYFSDIADGTPAGNSVNVDQQIFVRPIVASNSDGSNTAEYIGDAQEAADIQVRIDRIFSQAGIDVVWASPRQTNNTFINVGTGGGTRTTNDLSQIVDQGDSSGLGSSNPNVVDAYFVERVPGFASLSDNQANGLAFEGQSGLAVHVGDNLVGFENGRAVVARVIAHEIGHNLGLSHVGGTNNLMTTPASTDLLSGSQRNTILASPISRIVATAAGTGTLAGSEASAGTNLQDVGVATGTGTSTNITQAESSTSSIGGCGGCGVCGPCTSASEALEQPDLVDIGLASETATPSDDAQVDSSESSIGGCGGCGVCGPCTGGVSSA